MGKIKKLPTKLDGKVDLHKNMKCASHNNVDLKKKKKLGESIASLVHTMKSCSMPLKLSHIQQDNTESALNGQKQNMNADFSLKIKKLQKQNVLEQNKHTKSLTVQKKKAYFNSARNDQKENDGMIMLNRNISDQLKCNAISYNINKDNKVCKKKSLGMSVRNNMNNSPVDKLLNGDSKVDNSVTKKYKRSIEICEDWNTESDPDVSCTKHCRLENSLMTMQKVFHSGLQMPRIEKKITKDIQNHSERLSQPSNLKSNKKVEHFSINNREYGENKPSKKNKIKTINKEFSLELIKDKQRNVSISSKQNKLFLGPTAPNGSKSIQQSDKEVNNKYDEVEVLPAAVTAKKSTSISKVKPAPPVKTLPKVETQLYQELSHPFLTTKRLLEIVKKLTVTTSENLNFAWAVESCVLLDRFPSSLQVARSFLHNLQVLVHRGCQCTVTAVTACPDLSSNAAQEAVLLLHYRMLRLSFQQGQEYKSELVSLAGVVAAAWIDLTLINTNDSDVVLLVKHIRSMVLSNFDDVETAEGGLDALLCSTCINSNVQHRKLARMLVNKFLRRLMDKKSSPDLAAAPPLPLLVYVKLICAIKLLQNLQLAKNVSGFLTSFLSEVLIPRPPLDLFSWCRSTGVSLVPKKPVPLVYTLRTMQLQAVLTAVYGDYYKSFSGEEDSSISQECQSAVADKPEDRQECSALKVLRRALQSQAAVIVSTGSSGGAAMKQVVSERNKSDDENLKAEVSMDALKVGLLDSEMMPKKRKRRRRARKNKKPVDTGDKDVQAQVTDEASGEVETTRDGEDCLETTPSPVVKKKGRSRKKKCLCKKKRQLKKRAAKLAAATAEKLASKSSSESDLTGGPSKKRKIDPNVGEDTPIGHGKINSLPIKKQSASSSSSSNTSRSFIPKDSSSADTDEYQRRDVVSKNCSTESASDQSSIGNKKCEDLDDSIIVVDDRCENVAPCRNKIPRGAGSDSDDSDVCFLKEEGIGEPLPSYSKVKCVQHGEGNVDYKAKGNKEGTTRAAEDLDYNDEQNKMFSEKEIRKHKKKMRRQLELLKRRLEMKSIKKEKVETSEQTAIKDDRTAGLKTAAVDWSNYKQVIKPKSARNFNQGNDFLNSLYVKKSTKELAEEQKAKEREEARLVRYTSRVKLIKWKETKNRIKQIEATSRKSSDSEQLWKTDEGCQTGDVDEADEVLPSTEGDSDQDSDEADEILPSTEGDSDQDSDEADDNKKRSLTDDDCEQSSNADESGDKLSTTGSDGDQISDVVQASTKAGYVILKNKKDQAKTSEPDSELKIVYSKVSAEKLTPKEYVKCKPNTLEKPVITKVSAIKHVLNEACAKKLAKNRDYGRFLAGLVSVDKAILYQAEMKERVANVMEELGGMTRESINEQWESCSESASNVENDPESSDSEERESTACDEGNSRVDTLDSSVIEEDMGEDAQFSPAEEDDVTINTSEKEILPGVKSPGTSAVVKSPMETAANRDESDVNRESDSEDQLKIHSEDEQREVEKAADVGCQDKTDTDGGKNESDAVSSGNEYGKHGKADEKESHAEDSDESGTEEDTVNEKVKSHAEDSDESGTEEDTVNEKVKSHAEDSDESGTEEDTVNEKVKSHTEDSDESGTEEDTVNEKVKSHTEDSDESGTEEDTLNEKVESHTEDSDESGTEEDIVNEKVKSHAEDGDESGTEEDTVNEKVKSHTEDGDESGTEEDIVNEKVKSHAEDGDESGTEEDIVNEKVKSHAEDGDESGTEEDTVNEKVESHAEDSDESGSEEDTVNEKVESHAEDSDESGTEEDTVNEKVDDYNEEQDEVDDERQEESEVDVGAEADVDEQEVDLKDVNTEGNIIVGTGQLEDANIHEHNVDSEIQGNCHQYASDTEERVTEDERVNRDVKTDIEKEVTLTNKEIDTSNHEHIAEIAEKQSSIKNVNQKEIDSKLTEKIEASNEQDILVIENDEFDKTHLNGKVDNAALSTGLSKTSLMTPKRKKMEQPSTYSPSGSSTPLLANSSLRSKGSFLPSRLFTPPSSISRHKDAGTTFGRMDTPTIPDSSSLETTSFIETNSNLSPPKLLEEVVTPVVMSTSITSSTKTVTPSTKPVTPATKALSPATKPVTPVTKPVTPVTKPVTPVTKPVTPVTKPVTPVTKPVTPVTKPVTPVTKPVTHVTKPVTPVTKSVTPVTKPVTPVTKPVSPVTKPVSPVTKSVTPVSKPVTPVTKPVTPVTKPVTPVTKPVTPVTKPVSPVTKPVSPVTKPVSPVTKPVSPFTKPVSPVAKPVSPVAKPISPVAKPVSSVAKPVSPVAKPVSPVAKPVSPVAKPVSPVAKPVSPVAKPVSPVAKPVSPATKPVSPVAKPVSPATKPVSPVTKSGLSLGRSATRSPSSQQLSEAGSRKRSTGSTLSMTAPGNKYVASRKSLSVSCIEATAGKYEEPLVGDELEVHTGHSDHWKSYWLASPGDEDYVSVDERIKKTAGVVSNASKVSVTPMKSIVVYVEDNEAVSTDIQAELDRSVRASPRVLSPTALNSEVHIGSDLSDSGEEDVIVLRKAKIEVICENKEQVKEDFPASCTIRSPSKLVAMQQEDSDVGELMKPIKTSPCKKGKPISTPLYSPTKTEPVSVIQEDTVHSPRSSSCSRKNLSKTETCKSPLLILKLDDSEPGPNIAEATQVNVLHDAVSPVKESSESSKKESPINVTVSSKDSSASTVEPSVRRLTRRSSSMSEQVTGSSSFTTVKAATGLLPICEGVATRSRRRSLSGMSSGDDPAQLTTVPSVTTTRRQTPISTRARRRSVSDIDTLLLTPTKGTSSAVIATIVEEEDCGADCSRASISCQSRPFPSSSANTKRRSLLRTPLKTVTGACVKEELGGAAGILSSPTVGSRSRLLSLSGIALDSLQSPSHATPGRRRTIGVSRSADPATDAGSSTGALTTPSWRVSKMKRLSLSPVHGKRNLNTKEEDEHVGKTNKKMKTEDQETDKPNAENLASEHGDEKAKNGSSNEKPSPTSSEGGSVSGDSRPGEETKRMLRKRQPITYK